MINGRRYYHTAAFRLDERRFAKYEEAQGLVGASGSPAPGAEDPRRVVLEPLAGKDVYTNEVGGLLKKRRLTRV